MPQAPAQSDVLSGQQYHNLKVTELKDLLTQRGLPINGKKTDLIERLLRADEEAASTAFLTSEVSKGLGVSDDVTGIEDQHALLGGMKSSSLGVQTAETGVCSTVSLGGVDAPLTTDAVVDPSTHVLVQKKAVDTFAPTGDAAVSKIDTKSMSEEERRALRKAKFGMKTDADKKLERAKRFGLSVPELEEEKKKLRAMRFGLGEGQFQASDEAEAEKRKKRAERFGLVSEDEKKRKRAERFGMTSEEEKLQKRLQRFATNPRDSIPTPITPRVKVSGA
ncbi:sap domain-containing protein [Cystoisospora suis]|uniref:Sap domain-containing protein n=1 Tax=Cystoisospora suis TaxID=483139 RepID=A0A2C6LHT7_9APIC|nr:sap domain-containing protein [Cystoisospora suis]